MPAIVDGATMFISPGEISTTQDFPAIQVHAASLATCTWVVHVTVPPVSPALLTLAFSSSQTSGYALLHTIQWTAAMGAQQLAIPISGAKAQMVNNHAVWMRVSVSTVGPFTVAGSWLGLASDGGPGLASRSYTLDGINAI